MEFLILMIASFMISASTMYGLANEEVKYIEEHSCERTGVETIAIYASGEPMLEEDGAMKVRLYLYSCDNGEEKWFME